MCSAPMLSRHGVHGGRTGAARVARRKGRRPFVVSTVRAASRLRAALLTQLLSRGTRADGTRAGTACGAACGCSVT
jgi:hypothetical protein